MAAISNATIHLCGSHAGVSIGEDGPSQMALEDLAMMRAVHGSTVLYPVRRQPDGAHLVGQMADLAGISYHAHDAREDADPLQPRRAFPVGGSQVVRSSDNDRVAVIAAGITVHEALKAYDHLKAEGDRRSASSTPIRSSRSTKRRSQSGEGRRAASWCREDHWPEGGLGDAVLDALATEPLNSLRVVKLAVRGMPGSGTPAELLHAAGIDADASSRR